MQQIHPLQLQLLRKLLFSPKLRYTDLKPLPDLENNQLSFHLNKLVEHGWVIKEDNFYLLSATGKEYANRMDTDAVKIKPQAKISVIPCTMRVIDGKVEYLIYTRLKHPFYGNQGFPSGKLAYGESLQDGVKRELLEETGLSTTAEPQLFKIRHYLVHSEAKQLLEDKIMFMFKIVNPSGELQANEEGKHEWVAADQVKNYLIRPWNDVLEILEALADYDGQVEFKEMVEYTSEF
jgi:ADP-ribose pyrophosphatase YjhB (NUDIX family)